MSMISACCMNTADGTKMPSICTSEMKCRSACPLDYVVWYRQTISLYLPHLFSFFLFMIHLILTIGWWTRIPYLSCLMLRGCLEMQHSEVADDYFSAHSFECGCWWFTSPFMLQMPRLIGCCWIQFVECVTNCQWAFTSDISRNVILVSMNHCWISARMSRKSAVQLCVLVTVAQQC